MSDDHARCAACSAFLPIARSSVVSWTTGLVVTGIGLKAAETFVGRVLAAAAGIGATMLIDKLARPVCGRCGTAG